MYNIAKYTYCYHDTKSLSIIKINSILLKQVQKKKRDRKKETKNERKKEIDIFI